jgi:Xaa-Pro aminopeptidase
MVFALEPKFVFPGLGVVSIEDAFLVATGGL